MELAYSPKRDDGSYSTLPSMEPALLLVLDPNPTLARRTIDGTVDRS
jgi:hypothetical protein